MRVVVLHNRKKERREEGRDEGGGRAMGEGRGGVGREEKGRKELEASWP